MKEYYIIYAWSDCPYCKEARQALIDNKIQFMFCLLDESPDLLKHLKEKHNWQTVPIVVHYQLNEVGSWDSEFIGGCSNLLLRFRNDVNI
tara:strand:+ start:1998 stop:2267 length:270 start_codon:yes stop_codon:yes gene_type:complete